MINANNKTTRLLGIASPDTDDPSTFPDTIKDARELKGRRIIKTHLSEKMIPSDIMQRKAKVKKVLIGFCNTD